MSEGKFIKYVNEGQDGYDTLEWLVGQSFCNGKIGMFGQSYGSHTQVAVGCLNRTRVFNLFVFDYSLRP